MPDLRFYQALEPLVLADLASRCGARPTGDTADIMIFGVAPLAGAGAGAVTFLASRKHAKALAETAASACFVGEDNADLVPSGCAALLTAKPQAAWAIAAGLLHAPLEHNTAGGLVHPAANLEPDVILAHGVVVGAGASIGRGTRIGPGAVIGPGVAIGRDCRIGPHSVIGFALLGDRVAVHAGAVIGEPGFGAVAGERGVIDIPQLGRVIIQDGVTVGANSCIDRGAFDDTSIGENTKIDNFVHIAHNVTLGRNCVLAAFTGISGSVAVGDGVQFGGKAGVADHLTIGSGAGIGAAASVFKDVPAGEVWTGFPARPLKRWMRETAWLARQAAGRVRGDKT
jgi:UDP-3-O-[3-hydroxymyristoyl] glucosamine N-acyltransferase